MSEEDEFFRRVRNIVRRDSFNEQEWMSWRELRAFYKHPATKQMLNILTQVMVDRLKILHDMGFSPVKGSKYAGVFEAYLVK